VGEHASALRRAAGDLIATKEQRLLDGTLGERLVYVFDQARQAGTTFDGMDRVRLNITNAETAAQTPITSLAGIAVRDAGLRFALAQLARITSATDFVSRSDVDNYLNRMVNAFDPVIERVADTGDAATYQALIALQAATFRDLTERSRPLPQMITYSFPKPYSALQLAQRLYGDGGRSDELAAENKVVHPAFMPLNGRALSI
jgi:prophage DNA circulation protein